MFTSNFIFVKSENFTEILSKNKTNNNIKNNFKIVNRPPIPNFENFSTCIVEEKEKNLEIYFSTEKPKIWVINKIYENYKKEHFLNKRIFFNKETPSFIVKDNNNGNLFFFKNYGPLNYVDGFEYGIFLINGLSFVRNFRNEPPFFTAKVLYQKSSPNKKIVKVDINYRYDVNDGMIYFISNKRLPEFVNYSHLIDRTEKTDAKFSKFEKELGVQLLFKAIWNSIDDSLSDIFMDRINSLKYLGNVDDINLTLLKHFKKANDNDYFLRNLVRSDNSTSISFFTLPKTKINNEIRFCDPYDFDSLKKINDYLPHTYKNNQYIFDFDNNDLVLDKNTESVFLKKIMPLFKDETETSKFLFKYLVI